MKLTSLLAGCRPEVQAIYDIPPLGPHPFARVRQGTIGIGSARGKIEDGELVRRVWTGRLLPRRFDGRTLHRTYLDSGATTLPNQWVRRAREEAEKWYSSPHTVAHRGAAIMTEADDVGHEIVGRFVNAHPKEHTVITMGSGATEPLNRVADMIEQEDSGQYIVVPQTEHSANFVTWLQCFSDKVLTIPMDRDTGQIDLETLRKTLRKYRGHVRLVAVAGVSNVTGFISPIQEIAAWSHEAGAEVLVDAAQMLAHLPIDMQAMGIDWLVLAPHKAEAPGASGVLIAPTKHARARVVRFGGTMAVKVTADGITFNTNPRKLQEPGTQNVLGTIMLAASLLFMDQIGMKKIQEHERQLTQRLMEGFLQHDGALQVYGDTNLVFSPRAGVVSFNILNLFHRHVAQSLDLYFNIAVRNGGFCNHLSTSGLLEEAHVVGDFERQGLKGVDPGMVRVTTGIYTSPLDIDRVVASVGLMATDREFQKAVRNIR